ncbi:unnamed protein product [Leptidea sinapis]|uniref:Uncharacterized protein n=1 Tax=Leptidea sinapis TaxID=189913 RepID=A0A5E4R4G9_9NEOP|nr:unnamed protein product [Leptidea sinapis]
MIIKWIVLSESSSKTIIIPNKEE